MFTQYHKKKDPPKGKQPAAGVICGPKKSTDEEDDDDGPVHFINVDNSDDEGDIQAIDVDSQEGSAEKRRNKKAKLTKLESELTDSSKVLEKVGTKYNIMSPWLELVITNVRYQMWDKDLYLE